MEKPTKSKKIFNPSHARLKKTLPYLILFLALLVVIFSILRYYLEKSHISLEKKFLESSQLRFENAIKTHEQLSKLFLDSLTIGKKELPLLQRLNELDTKELDEARNQLYKFLAPRYELLQAKGLQLVHFHTPDGKSFLRMHKPHEFGDDLTKIRPSILKMIEEQRFLEGFEVGKHFTSYRYIYPILNDAKNYIGSIEISAAFQMLMSHMNQSYKTYNFFILNEKSINKKFDNHDTSFFKKCTIDEEYLFESREHSIKLGINRENFRMPLEEDVVEKILLTKKEAIQNLLKTQKAFVLSAAFQNSEYLISFFPISNIAGEKAAAYICSIESNEELTDLHKNHQLVVIFATISAAFLSLFIYKAGHFAELQKAHNKILNNQKELEIYEKIVSSSQDLMSFIDKERRYRAVNGAYSTTYGIAKEEIIGQRVENIVGQELYSQKIKNALDRCLEGEIVFDSAWIDRDEGKRFLNATLVPYRNSSGEVEGIVVNIQDQTDLKITQENLEQLAATLEEKVESKIAELRQKDSILIQQSRFAVIGELLSMIAHQWRQPLNTISITAANIYLEYEFNKKIDGDFLKRKCVSIEDKAKELSNTIEEFSTYFRKDSCAKDFKPKSSIEKAYILSKEQLNTLNIEFINNVDENLEIHGMESEFEHILFNLITNSKEALEKRESKNKFIEFHSNQESEKVTIYIKDNGGGIDERIIDKIFDPYFTTKQQLSGAGIGLYLSRTIIEHNFDGEIRVKNFEEGVEFAITIKKGIKT